MPEPMPGVTEQLAQIQRQLQDLAARLERVERQVGVGRDRRRGADFGEGAPGPGNGSAGGGREAAGNKSEATQGGGAPSQNRHPSPRRSRAGGEVLPTGDDAARAPDWEALIGGRWALWVGSLAVFIALGLFLAHTWQALGEAGRLGIGFAAGLAFLALGGWARARGERWFGEGLTGGGLAILYLSTWAGAQHYGLLPYELAFALMVLTTAAGVMLAIRYDAPSLSGLATLGGFLTPVLLHSPGGGSARAFSFLTYVALLNSGILAVSLYKRWQGLLWLSLVATVGLMSGWASESYHPSQRWVVFTFVSLQFLLFVGASCFYSLIHREETRDEDLLLLFADAFLYAGAGYALLHDALGDYPGNLPLALAVYFSLLGRIIARRAPENQRLRHSATGLAVFFLSLAIPMQLREGWIAVAWSVEAALFLTLGLRFRSAVLRHAGEIVWALSLAALLPVLTLTEPAPRILFLNARALPLGVSILATGWMAVQTRTGRHLLAPGYAAYAVLGGAWLLAQETYLGCDWGQFPARETWQMGALFLSACWWSVYAPALISAGFGWRHAGLRANAMVVMTLAVLLALGAGCAQPELGWPPFFNLRGLAVGMVAAALGAVALLMRREQRALDLAEAAVVRALPVVLCLVIVAGLSLETYGAFSYYRRWFGEHWDLAAQMAISLVWTLCGVVLLAGGVLRGDQPIRLFALGLMGVTVLKVFLFDLSALDTPYRILSFGGLGLALIGISWLYSRYGIGGAATSRRRAGAALP